MKQCIAIDIGGTKTKYGVITQSGTVLSNKEVTSVGFNDAKQLINMLCTIIEEEISPEVIGIGLSTLGAVDEEQGLVIGACDNLPALEGLKLRDILSEKYSVPVRLTNDVNAAALGEAYFGACRNIRQFYCITLGTGIGGAYVLDRKVLRGANGLAGEVGYLWKGSMDTYYEERASVKAFLSKCHSVTDGNLNGIDIFRRSLEGDPVYNNLFEEWLHEVAHGIIDIIYMLDPGTIVIGGGISSYGELLTDRISKIVEESLSGVFSKKTTIIAARNCNIANMLGAVCHFIEKDMVI
jgi:predicted NBD/HSP70 family sugar kinase